MQRRGFTLTELVLVFILIGIVGAIAIPTFASVNRGSKDAASRDALTQIARSAQAQAALARTDLPTTNQLEAATTNQPSAAVGATQGSGHWTAVQDDGIGPIGYSSSVTEVSYKVTATQIGLAVRATTGDCILVRLEGVREYAAWTVGKDIHAGCTGTTALAGPHVTEAYTDIPAGSYGLSAL